MIHSQIIITNWYMTVVALWLSGLRVENSTDRRMFRPRVRFSKLLASFRALTVFFTEVCFLSVGDSFSCKFIPAQCIFWCCKVLKFRLSKVFFKKSNFLWIVFLGSKCFPGFSKTYASRAPFSLSLGKNLCFLFSSFILAFERVMSVKKTATETGRNNILGWYSVL